MRNTKPLSGNYHAQPGTADSFREALSTWFILQTKDVQELNCQTSPLAVVYSCNKTKNLVANCVHDPDNLLITLMLIPSSAFYLSQA